MIFKYLPIALAMFAGAALSAHAETFDYSYTVATGSASVISVSGSFDGNLNGNLITGLSNIAVLLNGVAVHGSGALYSSSYMGTYWGNSAVVSVDGSENNFRFSDSDIAHGDYRYTNAIVSINANALGSAAYQEVSAGSLNGMDRESIPSNWRVTAVPEPETFAMLLAGLGLVGAAVQRRKEKQA